MKKAWTAVSPIIAILVFIPDLALATSNAGDFAGGVAVGTGYANTYNAPTNGLIVQGNVGVGVTGPVVMLESGGRFQIDAVGAGDASSVLQMKNYAGNTGYFYGSSGEPVGKI